MSLFCDNIKHPLDELYDQCKEIVGRVIPREMIRYNADEQLMYYYIRQELVCKRLLFYDYSYDYSSDPKNNDEKIYRFEVFQTSHNHKTLYTVYFYYAKPSGDMHVHQEYLCEFNVGINGIIK
jgi:hypothetical protein